MRGLRLLIPLLVALAVAAPGAATEIREATPPPATEPSVFQQTGDLLFGRPVALVRLVAGVALLPLAWPVAAVLQDPGWAWDVCVADPVDALVGRPISHP